MKINRKKEGFIVHPFETGSGQYHASYGNHNKTVRNFKTLRLAKSYLAKHGMKTALYDSPSGAKTLSISRLKNRRRMVRKRRTQSMGFNWNTFR